MASFAKNVGYALMGALEGTAEVFEKEDKRRDELTKVTLSTALQRYNDLDDERKKKVAEIEAEDAAVNALKGQVITLKDGSKDIISEAQARAAIRRYGAKELNQLLLSESIKFGTEGKIGADKTTERSLLNLEAIESASAKGAGWFGETRYKDVATNTEQALRAMGIDPTAVKIPGKKEVSGVEIIAGEGTNKVTTSNKYTNIPGLAGGMITQVNSLSIDGKLTTSYRDLTGNDVTETVNTALKGGDKKFRIVDSYSALKEDDDLGWKGRGLAFKYNDDGSFKFQGYEVVYTKDGRVLRKGEGSNTFDTAVTDNSIITMPASNVAEAGGTSAIETAMDKISKEGRKAFQEYQTQAEALEYVENIFNRNIELLKIHGDDLVSDIGSFANLVTYVQTNISSGISVLKDELGEYIDLSGIDIGRAEERVANLKEQMANADPDKKLSLARDLYSANQIVAAYYYAKSTGDTRISNADFDQFFKTVSAGTAEAQMAVYKDRMRQAAGSVKSKYTTLTSYVGGDNEENLDAGDKAVRQRVLGSIPESRLPENIDSRITQMFDADVATKTTQQVAEEIDDAEKRAQNYGVELSFINPQTGQLTTNIDPNGVEAYVILDKSGNPALGTASSKPFFFPKSSNEKEDVERDLMLLLQRNYLP